MLILVQCDFSVLPCPLSLPASQLLAIPPYLEVQCVSKLLHAQGPRQVVLVAQHQ